LKQTPNWNQPLLEAFYFEGENVIESIPQQERNLTIA